MDYNKIKDKLGSWGNKLRPFIESEEFDSIFRTLKELSRKGARIFPDSSQTFRAFELCNYDNLKAIIVGMAPYHTMKGNKIVADGVALSCGNTLELQPSLEQWYWGIEQDLYNGLNLNMIKEPNLEFLCKQRVLMFNISLTVLEGKAGSHIPLWEPFTKFFFDEIIGNYNRGLPIVFLGKEAAKHERFINPMIHYPKVVEHPAAASYSNRNWKHENIFSWVNNILKQNNGEEYQIKWIKDHKYESEECPF